MPQNRLDTILPVRFTCNSGLPPDWNPDERDCSGADYARHRKHIGCNGHDDMQGIAHSPGERNGLGDPGASRHKTKTKRTNLEQAKASPE
ncbi:hypothetical protein A7K93_02950 [Candidatus Methylacidiphilum fumarolicum]|nr:hypothetical protein A7K73_00445 [Candidatus Methylacidiphilum fumarolicum]TFE74889.1 hypothetical protein A7K93_02950 [Candidatus Methylacidiphilum fumarolicum]TFE75534.1 hypothetical protein A7K72_01740 [Candidatus Methylacidiphilum fumarolicum]TFE77956.1 hypothetical protein A7D33_00100 [Candidatus Methylacidiphilum fumarolicum]